MVPLAPQKSGAEPFKVNDVMAANGCELAFQISLR
jgi:hypothetical protein